MKNLGRLSAVTTALLLQCVQLQAAQLTGDVEIVGATSLYDTDGDVITGPNVQRAVEVGSAGGSIVSATGKLTTLLSTDDQVQFSSWQFDPSTPVLPLWTASNVTFHLSSSQIQTQESSRLIIEGEGILQALGFDDTPAYLTWRTTAPISGIVDYTATVTAVPEPSTCALLMLAALLGAAKCRGRS